MRLYAQTLKNYVNINCFEKADEWHIRENEANTLYFRLVDLDKDGLRYISGATTLTVTVTFPDIDDASEFSVVATQPDANDKSLFCIALADSQVPATGNFKVAVDEDGVAKNFSVLNGIVVDLLNGGSC